MKISWSTFFLGTAFLISFSLSGMEKEVVEGEKPLSVPNAMLSYLYEEDAACYSVSAVVLSPNKKKLLVGHDNGDVFLIDAETGSKIREFPKERKAIGAVAWSADGTTFIVGRIDGKICFYNDITGQALKSRQFYVKDHHWFKASMQATDFLYALACNADATLVFVAITTGNYGCWKLNEEKGTSEFKWWYHTGDGREKIFSPIFAPDEESMTIDAWIIAPSHNGKMYWWDTNGSGRYFFIPKGYKSLYTQLSPNSKEILIATATEVGLVTLGKEIGYATDYIYKRLQECTESSKVVSALFDGNGKYVFIGTNDGTISAYSCKDTTLIAHYKVETGEKLIALVAINYVRDILLVHTELDVSPQGSNQRVLSDYSLRDFTGAQLTHLLVKQASDQNCITQ